MKVRYIGIIDGLTFFIGWSLIGISYASYWYGVLAPIIFILLPSSIVVAWRGASLSRYFSDNTATLSLFVTDGFKWGFVIVSAYMAWSVTSQVFAAGGPLDGASFFSLGTIKYIVVIVLPISILGGILGATHGAVYFYLNRWLHS